MLTRRAAFTLMELIIAVALLGGILGAMLGLVSRQRRFYAGAAQIVAARGTLREAIDLLPRDLRGLAPAEGDVYAMSAQAIEYRASMGMSVVCTVAASRRTITIAPSSGVLTQWSSEPQAGDSLWLFDPGAAADDSDDRWRIAAITATPSSGNCPMSSGFTSSLAEESRGFALDLDRPLPASINPGSAVRFFRRARYELYRASDGKWYLGYLDCLASRAIPCSAVQPVSGPYLPGRWSPAGFALSYFDGAGIVTAARDRVARVDLVARAETSADFAVEGMAAGPHRDSLAVSIHLRN